MRYLSLVFMSAGARRTDPRVWFYWWLFVLFFFDTGKLASQCLWKRTRLWGNIRHLFRWLDRHLPPVCIRETFVFGEEPMCAKYRKRLHHFLVKSNFQVLAWVRFVFFFFSKRCWTWIFVLAFAGNVSLHSVRRQTQKINKLSEYCV